MTEQQLIPHHAERLDFLGTHGPIAALRTGGKDARANVLLVPGYTGSKEDFAPLLEPLREAAFDVVAIDLPGQYESPGPEDEAAYTPQALGVEIGKVIEVLAAEGRQVLVLGHSYGGLVARAAVLADAPVHGLTLLDSGPGPITDPERVAVLDAGTVLLREHGKQAAWDMRAGQLSGLSQALRVFREQRFVRSSAAALIAIGEILRDTEDLVTPLAQMLASSAISCLVACGENDDAWSVSTQQRMAERLDADFAVLPDCGHSPNTENPEILLATLIPTWNAWLD